MSDELHSLFTKAVNKSRDKAYRKGLVGRHNVDTTISYSVVGRADFLYVTLDNKTVITAINQAGVPQTEDYPVLLRKNLLGQWVIVDRDVSSSLGAPTAIPPSGVVAHATSHQHGGSDEVATATPGANAIVKADADGKIGAGWIDDADINLDNVTEGTTNKFFDATEQSKLAGIEALADVTDAGNVGSSITGVSTDDTIADADVWGYLTSGALVKTTWANIKAVLKTYFDTLYNLYVHPNHTGDVTSVADGATTIGASKVLTTMIANDNVTFAKMQNIATDSLIGRDTASSGDPENILLNATLSMDGAGNLQRAALTGDVTASAGSNATTIANDAVTNAKSANMAADTIKGRANGAGTGDPTDLTATQVRTIINVADGANAYTHPNHTGDVTSTGDGATVIGANKVLTAMILDAQITLAKQANLAQATIIGRASGAGTGVPTALTAAQVVAIIQSSIDHGGIGGLSDDDHTQYALLAGRAGGQTLKGGTASGNDLTLMSTNHATKGNIFFGVSTYDEVNNRLGIGTTAPSAQVHVWQASASNGIYVTRDSTTYQATFEFDTNRTPSTTDPRYYFGLLDTVKYFAMGRWTGATLYKDLVIDTDGDFGFGVAAPQSKLHAYDTTGGFMFVNETGIVGSAVVLVPNATGDVVKSVKIVGVARHGVPRNYDVSLYIESGGTGVLDTGGGNVLTFTLNANGELSVARTTGTATWEISVLLVWL